MFEPEIVSYNAAIRMTKADFSKGFLSYPEADAALDYLTENCPDCEDINFDGHFGPYILFTVEANKYKKASSQMIRAIKVWLGGKYKDSQST